MQFGLRTQMRLPLFQRRLMLWPTLYGWILLGVLTLVPPLLWWFQGESFLATTSPLDADVLVVEGWISLEGVRAAALEFKRGNYRYVVATGGLTGESWSNRRWSYAVEAHEQLVRAGIPSDQVILAESRERETQRTYEMALSAWAGIRAPLEFRPQCRAANRNDDWLCIHESARDKAANMNIHHRQAGASASNGIASEITSFILRLGSSDRDAVRSRHGCLSPTT